MFYRSSSEDCIYLRAERVLTQSPVTPAKRIAEPTYSTRRLNSPVLGNSVDVKGNSVDVKGNSVDVKGKSVDVKGNSAIDVLYASEGVVYGRAGVDPKGSRGGQGHQAGSAGLRPRQLYRRIRQTDQIPLRHQPDGPSIRMRRARAPQRGPQAGGQGGAGGSKQVESRRSRHFE
eukprot:1180524-Prorocentrum_minimum.AAC.1